MSRKDQILNYLKENPNDSFLLFGLAKEYEKEENDVEAIKLYIKIRELDVNYVGLYYHLGKLYENQDNETNATMTYKEGMIVAQNIEDRHAYSELQNALTNLELGI